MCKYIKYLVALNLPHLAVNVVKNSLSLSAINDKKFADDDRGFGRIYRWRTLDNAFIEAKETGKPVFLIFHKPWCPICQQLKKKFSKSFRLVELSEQFVMVNVENDANIVDKQDKYQPDGKYVPRILFFTPDGELIQGAYNQNPSSNPKYRYFYSSPAQIIQIMLFVLRNRDSLLQPSNSEDKN